MPEQKKREDALTQSMRLHDIYPRNLSQTTEFPHVLDLLSSLLSSSQKLFKEGKDTLTLRDLQSGDNGSFKYHDEVLKGTNKLDEFLTVDKPDPHRRFCFIQSASSRDPLECSRTQLTKVFSRHQVMAKFLEMVFTFERREKPHNYASFQCEDIRAPLDNPSSALKLPGSCMRIQHCFNLLGMEPYESEPIIWRQRQVAAYHSFDPLDGKVFWTVIKGNGVIQGRMKRATDKDLASLPQFANSIYLSFQQSLREHLLLLQWAVENWMLYIQFLENKARGKTEITRYPHIKELADDVPVRQMEHRKSTMDKSHPVVKHNTDFIRAVSEHIKSFSRHAHVADKSSKTNPSGANANGTMPEPSSPLRTATHLKYETIELDKLATFSDLQDLTSIMDELRSGVSIIEQNKRVFTDMRARYIELGNSVLLRNSLHDQELITGFQSAIGAFTRQISQMSADLENYQARLRAILETTDQARDMYNYIFQVRNTQNTEFYAGAAQESSEVMQELTVQMHEKTMSMHLITIFTLIFLPGTFVATLFSSGILIFGKEGESGFGTELGDWKVRMASLKLFFVICFPLLAVTLGVWFLAYRNVRNSNSKKIGDEEDGTLDRTPETG